MSDDIPSPSRCPLCRRANHCEQCQPGPTGNPCWCFDTEIAPEALRAIPRESRGKACICASCALGAKHR